MRKFCSIFLLAFSFYSFAECPAVLNYQPRQLTSTQTTDLCEFQGQVLLVVNTASQCGFTPQFTGLEQLYQQKRALGFTVLGFPSNDFFQEHKDAKKTAEVCYANYGVSFPMFAMGPVRGKDAQPMYQQLAEISGIAPKWNFYKYLIGRDGNIKAVFASTTEPDDPKLLEAIEHELQLSQP